MNISFLKEKGNKYLVYILIGLLVLVLCIPTGSMGSAYEGDVQVLSDEGLEGRLERTLSAMDGVGAVQAMITTDSSGQKVCGVVIVAEGAGNATINARISDAVKALFSIEAHKISIVKMSSQEDSR